VPVKRIGILSFGHWTPSPHSQVRTAADSLLQSIELAVAAEELLTVPNQLGLDYNAHANKSILKYVAPEIGWR
jgi:hypothetical protein